MIQRQYRLRKNSEFKKVYQHGKSAPSKYVVLYFKPNRRQKLRIGISVSKKVGGSVVRSRVKRILREAVRHHLGEIVPGVDIILIARGAIKGIKSTEVEQSLVKLLGKYRLLDR